jgi:hypothetical protein
MIVVAGRLRSKSQAWMMKDSSGNNEGFWLLIAKEDTEYSIQALVVWLSKCPRVFVKWCAYRTLRLS